MLAAILDACGVRTASFTSPHLLIEQDSILMGGGRTNGKMVSDHTYKTARDLVEAANVEGNVQASSFELLTATAFKVFSLLNVEVAVVEVGLGGTLDATNVLPPPLVCVLCPIAIDHVAFLGTTVKEIASHKAGIIKTSTLACVVAKQHHQDAFDVIEAVAKEKMVPVYAVERPATEVLQDQSTPSAAKPTSNDTAVQVEFPSVGQYLTVYPGLEGMYQLENIATATRVCSVLNQIGVIKNISCSSLAAGLASARNPGRLEWVQTEKYGRICLDGAHNEDGVAALARHLQRERKNMANSQVAVGGDQQNLSVAFVVGFSGQKDVKRIFEILELADGDEIYPVSFSQPEGMKWIFAMPPDDIAAAAASSLRYSVQNCRGSLQEALETIDRSRTPICVVCGSLYLVAQFYRTIKII